MGESAEFAPVTVVPDTVADLTFPPGVTMQPQVNARNAAGQSGPSPVVTMTVPQAAA